MQMSKRIFQEARDDQMAHAPDRDTSRLCPLGRRDGAAAARFWSLNDGITVQILARPNSSWNAGAASMARRPSIDGRDRWRLFLRRCMLRQVASPLKAVTLAVVAEQREDATMAWRTSHIHRYCWVIR